MEFYDVLDEVLELLRSRGRVSYGALKRQYDVDDAFIEDLKNEIIVAVLFNRRHAPFGLMFWFRRNKLVGSYLVLMATRRS